MDETFHTMEEDIFNDFKTATLLFNKNEPSHVSNILNSNTNQESDFKLKLNLNNIDYKTSISKTDNLEWNQHETSNFLHSASKCGFKLDSAQSSYFYDNNDDTEMTVSNSALEPTVSSQIHLSDLNFKPPIDIMVGKPDKFIEKLSYDTNYVHFTNGFTENHKSFTPVFQSISSHDLYDPLSMPYKENAIKHEELSYGGNFGETDENEEIRESYEPLYEQADINNTLKWKELRKTAFDIMACESDERDKYVWQCSVCEKAFKHQYTLARHMPTHTNERNHKCETCGKAFRQMSTLTQHRVIHSNIRPFQCEKCLKTFNRVSTLISHRKTHNMYKPHVCRVCGKAFHQKGNLKNHMFIHTDERPYKCDICNKGFNQRSNLMCHKQHTHCQKMPRELKRFHSAEKENIKKLTQTQNQQESHYMKKRSVPVKIENNIEQNFDISARGETYCRGKNKEIFVDLIKTHAMTVATENGQTPYALWKPLFGTSTLVKVTKTEDGNQNCLIPVTPEQVRQVGNLSVTHHGDGKRVKTVKIKIPVVAIVSQSLDEFGNIKIDIEPPACERENSEANSSEPNQTDFAHTPEETSCLVQNMESTSSCMNDDIYCGQETEIDSSYKTESYTDEIATLITAAIESTY